MGRNAAIQYIADLAGVPEGEAARTLAAVEAQPSLTREPQLRPGSAWRGRFHHVHPGQLPQ